MSQERYVSLDPANAEAENARIRREVWAQRSLEAQGGEPSLFLSAQFALTASVCVYARMRRSGFAVFPLQWQKKNKYLALYGAAVAGSFIAT